jgi:dTDP-4-dehydrorhamnose 3,5-epimerase
VIFRETKIAGVFAVEVERHLDERGSFARLWCARELEARGLDARLVQCSLSVNTRKGTLRGMHYSVPPHAEAKIVRCVRGAIYDVLVDVRRGSATFGASIAEVLTADNAVALYVPEGVAHGFLTIEDASDVLYQMSEFYDPQCARGARWNDPALGIRWPEEPQVISERDRSYPDFEGDAFA